MQNHIKTNAAIFKHSNLSFPKNTVAQMLQSKYFLITDAWRSLHKFRGRWDIGQHCKNMQYLPTTIEHVPAGQWRRNIKQKIQTYISFYIRRADSRFVPSQWEKALLCNDVSHWLGASLESALFTVIFQAFKKKKEILDFCLVAEK